MSSDTSERGQTITCLFQPFERVAGGLALVLGAVAIVLSAALASSAGLIHDGVLDLHFSAHLSFWTLLAQGLINWLSLSGLLLVAGSCLAPRSFRWIDLLGTQALARWPMLAATAYLSIPGLNTRIRELTEELMSKMPTDPSKVMASSAYLLDAMWLTLISLPSLVFIAWMIWLMYHAYSISTDMKGSRAVFSFVAALVLASIFSKVLIIHLVGSPLA